MGKGLRSIDSYYVHIQSSPEQDLQAKMNITDRKFIRGLISNKEWYKMQMKAIKRYRKICQKV